jgi:WD40 repeat protein
LRRRRARFISILSVITALAVATSVVAVVAVVQGAAAISQRNRALSAAAGSYADTLYTSNPSLAAQLSLAAYRLAPTPEAFGSVLNATGKILSGQAASTGVFSNIIAFNSTGSTLETGSADILQIWHVNPAKPTEPTFWFQEHNPHPNKWIFEIWPNPADSTMLATIDQNHVYLIDWSGKVQVISIGSPKSPIPDALAFSHDGHLLAVGQGDGTVQFWDIENPAHPVALGAPFADSRGRGTSVINVAFSSNGSVLATESGPYTYHGIQSVGIVRLWNIDQPTAPKLMSATLSSQGPMAFSPAASTLATIQSDDSVQLWDVADPSHPKATGAPLLGHTSNITAMTFSPNGRKLATASIDYSLRLWDVSNPSQPAATAILGKESTLAYFYSLAFSSNGLLAATALTYGADKKSTAAQTWLWQTDPKQAGAVICAAASPSQTITRVQWQQVFPGQPYNPPC